MNASAELRKYASTERAKNSAWFFKTGPGQYGEGDKFLGVRVPDIRLVAKKFQNMPLPVVEKLLQSAWHEERLLAVIILVKQFERGDSQVRRAIYEFYLAHTENINNWDIVDSSARQIVGGYLFGYPKRYNDYQPLRQLAASNSLWERRIAIIATQYWLTQKDAQPTLALAEILLHDPEDLMHKAVGWMLREVGKYVDPSLLREFLTRHAAEMPRTMLRYSIEHFDPQERKMWLGRA